MHTLWAVGVGDLNQNYAATPPEPAQLSDRTQLLEAIARLKTAPWKGWPVGTRVIIEFADATPEYPEINHYKQPDMTYEVTGDGSTFVRRQTVRGKVTTQQFKVSSEGSLPPAPRLSKQNAKRTKLRLNGLDLESDITSFSITSHPGGEETTTYWTSREQPEVLLRREEGNGNYWEVIGFATRKIGEVEYRCVVTKSKMDTVFGFVVTIEYLHASVPGHVVESVKELQFKEPTADQPKMFVSREFVKMIHIPQQPKNDN